MGENQDILTGCVLVVDDDDAVREEVIDLLRSQLARNVQYVSAASGQEALECMKRRAADVVLSDFRMPNMDGLELLLRIQAQWPKTVRMMMSSHGDRELVLKALNEVHVHSFIPKPIAAEDLSGQIAAALLVAARVRLQERVADMQDEVIRDVLQTLNRGQVWDHPRSH